MPHPLITYTPIRLKIWGELESLKESMRSDGGAPSIADELERIALTVAFAIFNTGEYLFLLLYLDPYA